MKFKIQSIICELGLNLEIIIAHDLYELKTLVKNDKVDILFLDIIFDSINSIQWAKTWINPITQVVFMTAYPWEASEISEVPFVYFLIKSRMTDAMIRKALLRALREKANQNDKLIIKSKYENHCIEFNDIVYIECAKNNLKIYLRNQEILVIYLTLKTFSTGLPPQFLQCHRGYIVNMNHISSYHFHEFKMENGEILPISPKRYNEVIQIYSKYITNAVGG